MREYGVTAEDVCKRALALLENRGRLKAEPWRRIGNRRQTDMTKRFNVGDHVTWNSEAGHVSGRIIKVHKKNLSYKGYIHHASKEEPQYEIKSDKTDHIAIHKRSALKKTNG
jgi:hypothetical protein